MSKVVDQSFLDLVRRSQLVEEDQLSKFLANYEIEHGQEFPERQEALAEALVEAELLTDWQADKLLAGKHRGFILGKYKLLGQLGKGGMSTVYLAEHVLMRARRAIKVLPKNRVKNSMYLDRFRIEARAAAKLDDPNIVRAYDIDQEGDTHYLVMEYVEGQDLHLLVKDKGALEFESAADYIAQVACGLEHAHQMGLIHRDIKPANCLLDTNGVVKLLDMGLARITGDEASLTLDNIENVLGTADYLAPEQALNSHQADQRSDIYSLGCTLYFLLTGHPPYPEGSISERLLKHQVEPAPSILKERPDIPPILHHICEKMMAKDPKERYHSAGEIAGRIRDWLGDRGSDVKDSGMGSGTGSGVGSDVFRRFAQSLNRTASESTGGSKVLPADGSLKSPTKGGPGEEEDLSLAPLEEEQKLEKKPEGTEVEHNTDDLTSSMAETISEIPPRSLIEETLAKSEQAELAYARFRRQPGELDPLRPPGFSPPSYGTPAWVYVVIGLGMLAVLGVVLLLASS